MASLSYSIHGQGTPVVFLHGFCESKEIWQEFLAPLETSFQSIVVDMPGFGKSTSNTNYQSIDAMAEEVHLLLQELSISKSIIIAHSLGGYVGLALAEKYPESIAGLGLFHSTAYPDTEEKKQGRNKTSEAIRQNGMPEFLENFIPGLFYKERHTELQETITAVYKLTSHTPAPTAIAATLAMRDRPDRTHVLRNSNYPVLFIAGKNDNAVVFESAREQFYLPDHSIVQALSDTAHMGMFEKPEETRAMVKSFVEICQALQK
ncbi:alpha/beta hydrolase [Cytophagaceae bacterium DM2B3-1]|uniref:Alpha/beta hydrolase n=1 Tax=Xanthocytophaga flava TaxID=3048013 RepID=A0ABT7CFZ1_9BACT|nr:alpha/beta hydrolase [Xanthocytophaga flavus]MDJ1491634.1 alpha/beta hydrolase [Xanthocytophaga flavus]